VESPEADEPLTGRRMTPRAVASAEEVGTAVEPETHRFLTPERIDAVAVLAEQLIVDGLSWIERRKEHVTILDDASLRRQISVDFSLRRTASPIADAVTDESPEQLYCAPVFMLPKAPANLMAFDLVDETGQSLRLLSRLDNARVSGAVLRLMAKRILHARGWKLPAPLAIELTQIAEVDSDQSKQRAARVANSLHADYAGETRILAADERFQWWLATLTHSSIVVVIYRAVAPRRKILKLTFEQPIESQLKWRTSLGWHPYEVWVDSPLIEARTYHFEAEAPPGLRITEAKLSDDRHKVPVEDNGFLRRIHLYRQDAARSGAATAVMRLCVGAGFGGGAFMAASLTTGALVGAAVFAEQIATNPTSAPALLLFLPGLIATYIARPDQHPLTTRLLWGARRALLAIALIVYLAAGRVALSGGQATGALAHKRTDALRLWLYPSAGVSALLLAALAVTYVRVRRPKNGSAGTEHSVQRYVAATEQQVCNYLASGSLLPDGYELVDAEPLQVSYVRSAWHGAWTLVATISDEPERLEDVAEAADDSEQDMASAGQPASWVTVEGRYRSHLAGALARVLLSNDLQIAQQFLAHLQDWAIEPPGAPTTEQVAP
jgi:hypothetical protein